MHDQSAVFENKIRMLIHQLVCVDAKGGIGKSSLEGKLPWNLPKEFKNYCEMATTPKVAMHFYVA